MKKDYGMAHICLWDRNTLELDGCCTHCCLHEAISGDLESSSKELEAVATQRRQKRLEAMSDRYYQQMETNYEECAKSADSNMPKPNLRIQTRSGELLERQQQSTLRTRPTTARVASYLSTRAR